MRVGMFEEPALEDTAAAMWTENGES
jgi:hypothetical protein